MMNFEVLKKGSYIVVFTLGVIILAYLFMERVFIAILPFLVGWFTAFAMRPIALRLAPKMRIKANILRVILTVTATLALLTILCVGVWAISREIWGIISQFSDGDIELYSFITDFMGSDGVIGRIFSDITEVVADEVYKLLISLIGSLASKVSSFAVLVPKALFFVLITVISSVYFAFDLERINTAVKGILPDKVFSVAVRLKDGFFLAFARYMRSYLILLAITFVEMALGLLILGTPYPLIVAAVIALLDMLPVIGVGTVLIPWSIWAFVSGRGGLGIGLLILFASHTVLRQTIEPKIVGKNLGVHPLLTLVFLYTGYTVFGFIGLIMVPVFTVLVNIAIGKNNASEIS